MVTNKRTPIIIAAIMTMAAAACLLCILFSDQLRGEKGEDGISVEYQSALFNTEEPIDINISIDEAEWNDMLANSTSEEYYSCDVTINGETYKSVGIRPKGNTSLSSIASDPDTDRYSLKLEFDQFVNGQTCHGLDKLILNNSYADSTNMKEAIIYDMYQYLGVDASLYNYAKVSINGEYWGVYLALEAVEDSFMLRNYGTSKGNLYKPDSMELGDADKSTKDRPDASKGSKPGNMPQDFNGEGFKPDNIPEGFNPGNTEQGEVSNNSNGRSENVKGGGPGGFSSMPGKNSGGANLNYTDDNLSSYDQIWDGSVTDTGTNDHKRVVTALKNICGGVNLEKYLDVDNVLKYMAVHVFSVNSDSLSGSMAHNYYLYENEGKLNIIPWDYNLSFGGMGMGGSDASSVINDAIDTPFNITEFFNALYENEEYLERYHAYLAQLVNEYVNGGKFDETYNRIRSQIDELVAEDPTAFYTYEEYEAGASMLYNTVLLRGQSILGQLDGSIPSTDSGQQADRSTLIDASTIDLKTMGVMNNGGGTEIINPGQNSENSTEEEKNTEVQGESEQPQIPDGNAPEGFNPDNMPDQAKGDSDSSESRPDSSEAFNIRSVPDKSTTIKNVAFMGGCLLLMIMVLLGAMKFNRRR